MLQQKIVLQLNTDDGKKLGELKIGASYEGALTKGINERVRSFRFGEAFLENVLVTRTPGDSIPLEFLENSVENLDTRLLLLEETDYQVLFRSEVDLDENRGDMILQELTQGGMDRSIVIEKWLLDEDSKNFRGVLNFASYVGKSFFNVKINGLCSVKFPFEVRSKKIGYHTQYPAMIGDISEVCSGLILDRSSPLFQDLQFSDKPRLIHYEDYMFLEYLFSPDRLPLYYEMIRRNPYMRLWCQEGETPLALASNIGHSSLVDFAAGNGEYMATHQEAVENHPQLNGLLPIYVTESKSYDNADIPENQLVKDLLLSIDYVINRLLDSSAIIGDGYVKDRLNEFKEMVQEYLSDQWLADISNLQFVPSNSQVLQKKEGYREILQYHLNLDLSFRFRWKELEDNVKGYNRKLSQLYEYWCFLELVQVLTRLSDAQTKYDDLFERSNDGWSVRLKRGAKSIKDFYVKFDDQTIKVSLMYNRSFSKQKSHDGFNSYTFQFRPDYTLCIDSGQNVFLIHFDAKYRSDREESKIIEADDDPQEITRTFWEDDVCKMHTYKDAILKTEGAYILYPGDGEMDIFRIEENREIPSVGAFSLTPSQSKAESERLEWFIKSILIRSLLKS